MAFLEKRLVRLTFCIANRQSALQACIFPLNLASNNTLIRFPNA